MDLFPGGYPTVSFAIVAKEMALLTTSTEPTLPMMTVIPSTTRCMAPIVLGPLQDG